MGRAMWNRSEPLTSGMLLARFVLGIDWLMLVWCYETCG